MTDKKWSVSLTLSVIADSEQEAIEVFSKLINLGEYDHDSMEVEEETE